jgi:integrative and conjugative element protein (TIGR02256 family)
MQIWRSADNEYTVTLEDGFLKAAQLRARQHHPKEVGTSLVGEYSNDGKEARVTGISPLPPDSCGTRFSFSRGVSGLTNFFATLFRKSRGRAHYVGEWHSHPGGVPVPSSIDDANMRASACDTKAHCPECILVILGFDAELTNVGVYVYSRAGGRLVLSKRM